MIISLLPLPVCLMSLRLAGHSQQAVLTRWIPVYCLAFSFACVCDPCDWRGFVCIEPCVLRVSSTLASCGVSGLFALRLAGMPVALASCGAQFVMYIVYIVRLCI